MHLNLVDRPDTPTDACLDCGHTHTADGRCHSAYDVDYCPLCGTAARIGTAG